MANEVTVTMPLALTLEMIRAVRDHDTTSTDDRDEWHRRLGWLICAWDVLIEQRNMQRGDGVVVPREALEWLLGEGKDFEPSNALLTQQEGYKLPQFWWRTEFKKRAGL